MFGSGFYLNHDLEWRERKKKKRFVDYFSYVKILEWLKCRQTFFVINIECKIGVRHSDVNMQTVRLQV